MQHMVDFGSSHWQSSAASFELFRSTVERNRRCNGLPMRGEIHADNAAVAGIRFAEIDGRQ